MAAIAQQVVSDDNETPQEDPLKMGDPVRVRFLCSNLGCNRLFKWKKNLNRHQKYECGRSPQFRCPQCDYASKFTSNVRRHMQKHNI
ncbi:longitudinals lacking protein, isoforms A/B/D/L-like isoform X2 [Calliopsis andreniformis]|uniref:longitudinals lacking protein, isoforms A/B/D/L-like isoform X2 n=1 Tax=Calliopsis andreniformis TaxID=337506 RepID=UPI003FCE8B5A